MKDRFSFGKNWSDYLKSLDIDKVIVSVQKDISRFLGINSLSGKKVLDIGSGSGIHSLAFLKLGAEKVVSIDLDEFSIKCTQALREKSKIDNWEIKQGSMLDWNFLNSLGYFDIIYCWGVAHHTGDMKLALENISKLGQDNSLVWLALYNKVDGLWGSKNWLKIKRFYNKTNFLIKKIMEFGYLSFHFLFILSRLKNPLRVIKNYHSKRGMSWKTDLIDWLGGYPYEYISNEEVFSFFHSRGWSLENIKTTNYLGCNQFLFKKDAHK